MGNYIGQVLAPLLSFLVAWIVDSTITDDPDTGNTINTIAAFKFIFYGPIFLGQLTFAILGSDFILFSWIDNVLIFLIMHYVSNVTFLFLLLDLFIFFQEFFLAGDILSIGDIIMIAIQIFQDYYYWNLTMQDTRQAIRYMDPEWNEIAEGELWYPSLFYVLGLAEKKTDEPTESASKDTSDDDIKDKIINF